MNKEPVVGIEMSSFGKLDCITKKSFAYGRAGSFQESRPPRCLLSSPLTANPHSGNSSSEPRAADGPQWRGL